MQKCAVVDCKNEARMGLRTTRPMTRGPLHTAISWDLDHAPKLATLYCKRCAQKVLKDLTNVLLENDRKWKDE